MAAGGSSLITYPSKELAYRREYERNYRAANREAKAKLQRRLHLEKTYGLSLEDYEAMVGAQNGLCAICSGPPNGAGHRLHVDHDHFTDAVRALLCGRCNSALGFLEEDVERMERMIDYLKYHRGDE